MHLMLRLRRSHSHPLAFPGFTLVSMFNCALLILIFSLQPVPTSPTSTSPTPSGTLGMSKMDAPSMQDVYILSPVSGLYSTRSAARTHRCLVITLAIALLPTVPMTTLLSPQGRAGPDVVRRHQPLQRELPVGLERFRSRQLLPGPGQRSVLLSARGRRTPRARL